jgi:hypothetical protein
MARHGVSTLIVVARKTLVDLCCSRVLEFLDEQCGQIVGWRAKTTVRLDAALLPTLARAGKVAELTAGHGFVIVDECQLRTVSRVAPTRLAFKVMRTRLAAARTRGRAQRNLGRRLGF